MAVEQRNEMPKKHKTTLLNYYVICDNSGALKYVPAHLRTAEMCLAAVKAIGTMLKDVPEALKTVDYQC